MFDDIKQLAGKLAPPSVLALGLSAMIFGMQSQTLMRWPFFGEFVLDDALKAIMIAVVWFLTFAGWAIWSKVNPTYRDSVYDDLKVVRARFYDIDWQYNYALPWAVMRTDLKLFVPNIPTKHRNQLKEILILMNDCENYYEDRKVVGIDILPDDICPSTFKLMEKIRSFEKATDWVTKK